MRKPLAALAAAAAMMLTGALSACTVPASDPVDVGGDLRVLDVAEPRSLNPLLELVKPSQRIMWAIMDPLVVNNADFELVPGLATSWERTSDLRWEFEIEEGVTFHNGEPFDADAAAFSVLTMRDGGGALSGYFQNVANAYAEEGRLIVETEIPDGSIPGVMTQAWTLPPKYYAEVGPEEFGRAPIGTGPFALDVWNPGSEITVVRNDDYWAGASALDSITFSWSADAANRTAAVETGAADIAVSLPPQQVQVLEGNSDVTVEGVPNVRINFVQFNIFDPPFDDVRVREAAAHAINRDALVEAIFDDTAAIAWPNALTPQFTATGGHGDRYLEYDPERSCEILDEVGDIGTVTLHAPNGRYLNDNAASQAIVAMLNTGCFNAELDSRESGAFFELVFTQTASDMLYLGTGALYNHPDFLFSSYFKPDSVVRYCNSPGLTEGIADALPLADQPEQDEAYNALEAEVLFDLVCWVPLYQLVDFHAVRTDVQGFELRSDEYIDWRTLSLSGE